MERTHRKLSTRFTDGLGGDNTNGFAGIDRTSQCKVDTIAFGADTALGLAGKYAANKDLVQAVCFKNIRIFLTEHMIGIEQNFSGLGISDIFHRITAMDAYAAGLNFLSAVINGRCPDTIRGSAVILTDDNILADVDHSTSQITGVSGTKCGIGQAFTCASGRREVFQNGKAFTVVCLNWDLDGLTGSVRDKSTHTGQLTDLSHGASSTGIGHHVDGVIAVKVLLQCCSNILRGLFPLADNQTITFIIGNKSALELFFNLNDLFLSIIDQIPFCFRNRHIEDGDGDCSLGGVFISHCLDIIKNLCRNGETMFLDAAVNDIAQLFLADLEADLMVKHVFRIGTIHISQILRNGFIINDTSNRSGDNCFPLYTVDSFGNTQTDGSMKSDKAFVVGHDCFVGITVAENGAVSSRGLPFSLSLLICSVELITIDDHAGFQTCITRILDDNSLRTFFCLADAKHSQVVGTEDHILGRNCYRMTVLRTQQVVSRKHQDTGFCLRFCAQRNVNSHLVAVKVCVVRSTYQRMQAKCSAFNKDRFKCLNAETVKRRCTVQQYRVLFDDKFQSIPDFGTLFIHHFLGTLDVVGNAVLNQFLHYERTEQLNGHFLGNTALIDLQIRSDNDNGTSGIVNTFAQKVLTETSLLTFQHIGKGFQGSGVCSSYCSAATTVVDQRVHSFLKHTLLITNNDVRCVQLQKSFQTVIAVDNTTIEIVQIGSSKSAAVQLNHRTQFRRNNRKDIDDHPFGAVSGLTESVHNFDTFEDLGLLLTGSFFQLFAQLNGKCFTIHLLQKLFDRFGTHTGFKIIFVFFFHVPILLLSEKLILLKRSEAGIDDNIVCKVQNLFQHSRSEIQNQAHAAGNSLEVPDMRNRSSQDNMSHALTTHLGASNFNAAAITDLSFVADFLILSAVAFPILRRPKDPFAEQTVAFGLQGTVVNRLRFLYLTIRPGHDSFRRGDSNLYGIKR